MAQKKKLLIIALGSLFLAFMINGGVALSAQYPVGTTSAKLPRTFEKAHLGMAQYELTETLQRGRMHSVATNHGIVSRQPKDPYLQRVQYRFHHGVLREIEISYKTQRIPDGYQGLLRRLKESYGQPFAENQDEYDLRPDVLAVTKTIWKDEATTIVLTKTRCLHDGDEIQELVLKISDNALQEAYETEQTRHYSQKVLRVPIPLPDSARYQ